MSKQERKQRLPQAAVGRFDRCLGTRNTNFDAGRGSGKSGQVRGACQDCDRRLVAEIEIVNPWNKDRPDRCRAFAMKMRCHDVPGVAVSVVDPVTERAGNLYLQTLDLPEKAEPHFTSDSPATSAAICRWRPENRLLKFQGHRQIVCEKIGNDEETRRVLRIV